MFLVPFSSRPFFGIPRSPGPLALPSGPSAPIRWFPGPLFLWSLGPFFPWSLRSSSPLVTSSQIILFSYNTKCKKKSRRKDTKITIVIVATKMFYCHYFYYHGKKSSYYDCHQYY